MPHTATIKYDRTLVRRALNRYVVRRLGRHVFVLFGLLLSFLIYEYISGSWSLSSTYMAVALLVVTILFAIAYFARLRASEGFFDKADDPTVTITFSEEGVTTESALGSSELKWTIFDEVLKFSDIWLLVYATSGYMTLPIEQLSEECQHFIEAKMSRKAK